MALYYRNLTVGRKALDLAKEAYRLSRSLTKEEMFGMRSLLTRAAASIPANIAEGWSRESDKVPVCFFAVAQGSLAETDTFVILCEEIGWFPTRDTEALHALIVEVGKMLSALRRKRRPPRS